MVKGVETKANEPIRVNETQELEDGVSRIERAGVEISNLKSNYRNGAVRDLTEILSKPIPFKDEIDRAKAYIDVIGDVDEKIKQLIISPYNVYILLKHFFISMDIDLNDVDYLMEEGAAHFEEFYKEGLGNSNSRIEKFKEQVSSEYGEEYGKLMPQNLEQFENIILPFKLNGDTQRQEFYRSMIFGNIINYDGQELLLGDKHREMKGQLDEKLQGLKSVENMLKEAREKKSIELALEYDKNNLTELIRGQRRNMELGIESSASDFSMVHRYDEEKEKYIESHINDGLSVLNNHVGQIRQEYDELYERFYLYEAKIIKNDYPHIRESYTAYIKAHDKYYDGIQ